MKLPVLMPLCVCNTTTRSFSAIKISTEVCCCGKAEKYGSELAESLNALHLTHHWVVDCDLRVDQGINGMGILAVKDFVVETVDDGFVVYGGHLISPLCFGFVKCEADRESSVAGMGIGRIGSSPYFVWST